MKDFCLRHRITEIQKMSSWRDETSGFSAKRKNQFIVFERTRLKKKGCETTKEMEQKQFYKKGMNQ